MSNIYLIIESCKWQIVKADYDMSLVRWDYNRPKVFNGREQSVMLEQLPNGIKAYYSGNEGKEAGRMEGIEEMAKRMHAKGKSTDEIAEICRKTISSES